MPAPHQKKQQQQQQNSMHVRIMSLYMQKTDQISVNIMLPMSICHILNNEQLRKSHLLNILT